MTLNSMVGSSTSPGFHRLYGVPRIYNMKNNYSATKSSGDNLSKIAYLSKLRPMAQRCQGADWGNNKGMKWQVLGNREEV